MGAPAPGRPALNYTLDVRGQCRSCGAAIWWGWTKNQKRCPYDIDPKTGEPTNIAHFATCPESRQWSRKAKKEGQR